MSFVTDIINKELNRYYYDNIFVEGDLAISISAFDDFYLFELMEEKDGVDVPLDLSNLNGVNIVFFDNTNTVTIPRMKNAADINPAQGQVMFQISEKDSATILGLKNNNFYITLISGEGKEKDEVSVLKAKFYSLDEFNQILINDQKTRIESAIAQRISSLNEEKALLIPDVQSVTSENNSLKNSYDSLVEEYKKLEEAYKTAITKLRTVPSETVSSFTSLNPVYQATANVSVADLPVTQTPPPSEQAKKSINQQEQDLASNNELVILPSGGSSSEGSLPPQGNPFSNYSGSN